MAFVTDLVFVAVIALLWNVVMGAAVLVALVGDVALFLYFAFRHWRRESAWRHARTIYVETTSRR